MITLISEVIFQVIKNIILLVIHWIVNMGNKIVST